MNLSLPMITVLSFAGLASIIVAIGLFLRDLFGSGSKQNSQGNKAIALRRMPLVRDMKKPEGAIERIDHALNRLVLDSGIESSSMATCLMLICSGLLLGGVLYLWNDNLIIASLGVVIGMAMPVPYLMFKRSSRMRKMRSQMAEALDLLSRAVRAGESLDQAMTLVGEKTAEPLAAEFRRCSRQLEMGLSLPATMRAFAYRIPLMEIRIFASTLGVHRQSGGNLAHTLERMSVVIRDRLNYQRQLKATTAAGRFSAMLISSAGPLLFAYLFIFQSDYAEKLIALPLGQTLLTAAVVLELIGLIWIWRMLRPTY